MIADVIGSYLKSLEEREFDFPFMALLRAQGFSDIHFLHGSYEFGKDFIAKKKEGGSENQFCFQTKAGDLTLSDWGSCRSQIDLLRTNSLAHPSFDRTLPRKAIFVTTGRLVGGAALAAQDYKDHLVSKNETSLEVWDRETLIENISSNLESVVSGTIEGELLAMLGDIDQRKCTERIIEKVSRSWIGLMEASPRSAVIASIIANRLKHQGRIDLACYTALCLIRGAWASSHGETKPDSTSLFLADTGRSLFRFYASELLRRLRTIGVKPADIIWAHLEPAVYITYPVRALKIVEIVGLLGLLNIEEMRPDKTIEDFLRDFFHNNPGAKHPISDRWAVSLFPPVLLMAASGQEEEAREWLKGVVAWVGDHYENDGLGLANVYSSPDEEVVYLFGAAFEHVEIKRNPMSYLAAVVLDLSALLKFKDIYELARNDFLAVDASPSIFESDDSKGQYVLEGKGGTLETNMQYEERWSPQDGWKVAPHHLRTPASYYLNRIGRHWDHLAVSAVLRDRHFLPSCQIFVSTE